MALSQKWRDCGCWAEERLPQIRLFSLIGLILLIACLAIPNLFRAGAQTEAAFAVNSLRKLNVACEQYSIFHGRYPASLSDLGPKYSTTSTSMDLIDPDLASGVKDGYSFVYSSDSEGGNYTIVADPIHNQTWGKHFYTDHSGVIRVKIGMAADSSSTPL